MKIYFLVLILAIPALSFKINDSFQYCEESGICHVINKIEVLNVDEYFFKFSKCTHDVSVEFYFKGELKKGFLTKEKCLTTKTFLKKCVSYNSVFLNEEKYQILRYREKVEIKKKENHCKFAR